MSKKEWFVSVKHMQPSELEYYLEAQAANGYILKKLGELAPFYYEFEEGEKTKTKFVVDKTALAKDMYVDTLTGKGWELMGTVGPFYLWRQDYTDKRPKDFTDSAIRGKACKALSIGALIITLILVLLMFGYGYHLYQIYAFKNAVKIAIDVVGVLIQIPFIRFFFRAYRKYRDAM